MGSSFLCRKTKEKFFCKIWLPFSSVKLTRCKLVLRRITYMKTFSYVCIKMIELICWVALGMVVWVPVSNMAYRPIVKLLSSVFNITKTRKKPAKHRIKFISSNLHKVHVYPDILYSLSITDNTIKWFYISTNNLMSWYR